MLISHSLIPQDHNSRKLFLFVPGRNDILLKEQLKILNSDPEGLSERDLVIKVITPYSDRVLYKEVMNIYLAVMYNRNLFSDNK